MNRKDFLATLLICMMIYTMAYITALLWLVGTPTGFAGKMSALIVGFLLIMFFSLVTSGIVAWACEEVEPAK